MSASWKPVSVRGVFPDAGHAVDPYLVWAEASDFAGFLVGPLGQVPVLFELAENASANANAASPALQAFVERVRTGNVLNDFRPSRYGTAHVDRRELVSLAEAVRAGLLARFQLGLPRGERSVPVQRGPVTAALQIEGRPAMLQTIGVIDDGCCLAHERFRPGGVSRFVDVWDQDDHAPALAAYWDRSPAIPYGAELRTYALQQLFARHADVGEAPERAIYAALGRPEWGTEGRTHGAGVLHVLSPADARMIFVQLPAASVADSSGGSLGVYLLDGVRYIARSTQQLARSERFESWRTTINVSLGSIAGPHDGTTITEAALAEIGADPSVRIVLAAGNTSRKRVHGMRKVRRRDPGRFHVMVPPDNPRETFVEVWLPQQAADGRPLDPSTFQVQVTAPDGARSPAVGVDASVRLADRLRVQAGVIFCRRVAQGVNGTMILVAFRATRSTPATPFGTAPYGVWTIEVTTNSTKSADVHAWVERNDLIVGRRRPQQAFFVDDPEARYVSDDHTLSSIANGVNVTVVGGYEVRSEREVDYSAQGPTRGGRRVRPEFLGPSDESGALPGMQVPGFFSGWMSRMSGTSVAAPHVARWIVMGEPSGKRFRLRPRNPLPGRGARDDRNVPAIRP